MTWIKTVKPDEATGRLAEIYELTKSPHGTYDNVYISKSLRPETIMGHDTLYKAVLHHPDVTLPLWLLELIATYTSILNNCEYAATHHGHNYRTLLGDPARAAAIDAAMASGALEEALTDDPFLTHQVFALVTESLFPDQAVAFLVGAAKHLLRVQPPERRPLLAGLLELSGPGASI